MKLSRSELSFFLICGVVFATGCKDKAARVETSEPPPGAGSSAEHVSSAQPGSKSPPLTATQSNSTVRVQVVAGAIPPRIYAGAMLHRDEVATVPGLQGRNRCVLALLKGWTDEQLRNPLCKIFVVRNNPGIPGQTMATSFAGRLIAYDEQTGLAAIGYTDASNPNTGAGFHLEKDVTPSDPLPIVRGSSGPFSAERPVNRDPGIRPAIRVEAGTFLPKSGAVQFPPEKPENENDDSPVVLGANGKLIGFLSIEEGANMAKLVSTRDFKLDVKVPRLKLLGIGFGKEIGGQIPILIKTEPEDPKLAPRKVSLATVVSPDAKIDDQEGQSVPAPIQSTNIIPLTSAASRELRETLAAPQIDGKEIQYVLQLGWSATPGGMNADVFSKPFAVKLANKGGSIVASVTGLPNLTEVATSAQGTATEFAVETVIRDFHEIAGGRELLMQLDAAPFWKRFSLERNEWLPLPPLDLSNAYVTGNLSSLFILQRASGELRKYDLADLKQTAGTQLAAGEPYIAVLTGCNTDHAPVHVLTTTYLLAFSAENLQSRTLVAPIKQLGPSRFAAALADNFYITGDGLSLRPINDRRPAIPSQHYTSDLAGAHNRFFDTELLWSYGSAGVSGAYIKEGGSLMTTAATPDGAVLRIKSPAPRVGQFPSWLAPNSPTIFQFAAGVPGSIPVQNDRIVCSSYFDSAPFAEIEVPEWAGNSASLQELENKRWVAFDPYALRLGVVSADRKKWVVHQMISAPGRTQPVLLNWPDTVLTRGSELRFKPLILGGETFSAELLGAQSTPPPKMAGGQLTLSIAPSELSSLEMLVVKVPGKEGALSYSIPLHLLGQELEFAAAPSASAKGIAAMGAGFKSVATPKDAFHVMRSTLHVFNDPVREVIGPLGGHLVLVTTGGRLDFFSLESRKVTRTVPGPANMTYFSGAEALFEYNPTARTLTRISVPAGQRERTMTLPGNLQLHAVGLGTAPDSPLTLILEQLQRQQTERFGDLTFTMTESNREAVILDNRTFNAAGWAQPKAIPFGTTSIFSAMGYGTFAMLPKTVVLPASHDGQFVMMPGLFFALGHGSSYSVRFPNALTTLFWGDGPSSGSISGMTFSNSVGAAFTGRVSDDYNNKTPHKCHVTPCGRYRLIEISGPGNDDSHVEVRTVGSDRLLFHIGRLMLNRGRFEGMNDAIPRRMLPLGDNGPLAILSSGGKALEIIDCDIPRLAQTMDPADFHVTSQCPPYVISGATLEYQIQVNNPAAAAVCRLREPVSGASLSSTGHLRYTAPLVTTVTQVQLTTEILGTDGRTILHEFPIYVLPPPPRAPTTTGKPSAI